MKNDAFGRTINEIEDEARYGYAVGTVAFSLNPWIGDSVLWWG